MDLKSLTMSEKDEKDFLFHKFFYFLGSMKEMHYVFFFWIYLILLEDSQENRKLDKK